MLHVRVLQAIAGRFGCGPVSEGIAVGWECHGVFPDLVPLVLVRAWRRRAGEDARRDWEVLRDV